MSGWITAICGATPVSRTFDEGFCVLVGNRPWPTRKPHYVYYYWRHLL